MNNPSTTYRIQFHKDFNFDDFEKVLPYLKELGISTVYASPIFEATPGSQHGYDGVNPNNVNPEIGTEEQLLRISKDLKLHGISWLQDIVPNHMAFHSNNEWFMDVLEKGPQSKFASFFDVAWTGKLYHGRIMVPFLGSKLSEVIKNGELTINWNESDHRLVLQYFDSIYPLQPKSYATVLKAANQTLPQSISQLIDQIPKIEDEVAYDEQWNEFKLQLASLMKNEKIFQGVREAIDALNKDHEAIQQIVDEQSYRLCHWQETDRNINFRRFFTVNSLICLNIHNPQVFSYYHTLVKKLIDLGVFQGVRIDHIDGLYDPADYLDQLRNLVGEETYIVVEKILEPGEELPHWPIEGSTGYDFLAMVNNLFTNKSSEGAFTDYYNKITGDYRSIHQQVYDKKSYILYNHMAGELENLYRMFMQMGLVQPEDYAQMRTEDIKTAIAEFLIQTPVYRYYGNALPLQEIEANNIRDIFNRIKDTRNDLSAAVDLLENVLLIKPKNADSKFISNALRFYQRCMQFTGPLMAKGVEDTLMYTYNRFIGHNEVGDSPEAFGHSINTFHQMMKDRQQQWPLAINGTSTHDTKRGEDVRARLNVLTDVADEWLPLVDEWRRINAALKTDMAPDDNDEYFIYQTLVGAHPMPTQADDDIESRMGEYLEKALREAKLNSNWTEPNVGYEEAAKNFTSRLIKDDGQFAQSFKSFHEKIADFGIINSLSQTVLKFMCPGVPDVYQGTELWDLSLVDPDNRRPVDYQKRLEYLEDIDKWHIDDLPKKAKELWQERYSGKIKFWLINNLLKQRNQHLDLFEKGEYIPLEVQGAYRDNVFAFARKHQLHWIIVAVPLHQAQICKEQQVEVLDIDWKDTSIILPANAPQGYKNLLLLTDGEPNSKIEVRNLFTPLPFAILHLQNVHERSAGVLLHVTSLPSNYGVGDLGPEAYKFADFLQQSNQKYWQLLPLNPTEQGQGHSPYSSLSSKAGNPLLISPELLVEEKLLSADALSIHNLVSESQADYNNAEKIKGELFEQAWQTFQQPEFATMQQQFKEFTQTEAAWLHDFALFVVLKKQHDGKAWFQWPEKYKLRDSAALDQLVIDSNEEIEKTKWLQFIFTHQWKALRNYCNSNGIQLFGDMPFYISYDSADVWSDLEIFEIDTDGKMIGVAGVPPDAFSDDGQLWGMPVFKWDVLKKRNYDWWIQRFKKNMELFDVVRLDHFRAFADYWEVPSTSETAKVGSWKPGPGVDIFEVAQRELGSLPFIAEDLGDINDAVYKVRDTFDLPGMKVLQFTFGDDIDESVHSPHNYNENSIAYTGTHDNNTTIGWFKTLSTDDKKRIEKYMGKSITEQDIHLELSKLAYSSVSKTVIIPMQDILGLDEQARMNTPSLTKNNWGWRLLPDQLSEEVENRLRDLTARYNRDK